MESTHAFAERIVIDKLRNTGPCFLDDLIISLSHLSWTDIFTTVDRMSRDGRVSLRQVSYSKYQVIPSPELDTPRFQIPPVVNFNQPRSPG